MNAKSLLFEVATELLLEMDRLLMEGHEFKIPELLSGATGLANASSYGIWNLKPFKD